MKLSEECFMNCIRLLVIFVLTVTCYSGPAYAFKEDSTHRQLTAATIKPSVSNLKNYLINNFGFSEGYEKQLNGIDRKGYEQNYSILTWLQEGSEDEDALSFCRASNHFHNPIHSGDWLSSQMSDTIWVDIFCGSTRYSNVTWATGYTAPITSFIASRTGQAMGWDNARTYLYQSLTSQNNASREELLVKTFKSVGMVMHLLQDMAVPAHTRNDMTSHLVNSYNTLKWGSNPFEKYVIIHNDAINITPEKPIFTAPFSHTDFWDKDTYSGANPSTGKDQGLAEYSNANFFSDSTILTDGPSEAHTFPNPQISSASYICTDTLPGSKNPTKYVSRAPCSTSGGTVEHLAAVSLINNESDSNSATTIKKAWLDDNVHKTNAIYLLPRAVGYSAALLDYFFRGTIEISLPAQGVYATATSNGTFNEIRVNAKNTTTTGEEMTNGTLQLVVKYRLALSDPFQSVLVTGGPEQYIVIPEKNGVTALSKLTATELVFDLSTNPVPLWATNANIQVVFKGKLGNEADAVAVGFADISEPTPVDIYNNTDYVCLNNQWYHASSAEALAITDTNSDGKADRTDIYPHNISNIGIQFGPAGSTPLATLQHNNLFSSPALAPGQSRRLGYVLANYPLNYGSIETWTKISSNDQFSDQTEQMSPFTGQGFAMQNGLGYGVMFNMRGVDMWWGAAIIFENWQYPDNAYCDDSLLPIP